MNELDSQIALVPVQPGALVRKARLALAKRGLVEAKLLKSANAWFEKAVNAKDENDPLKHVEYLERTLALDPYHWDAQLKLAEAYLVGFGVQLDYKQGVAFYRKAKQICPDAQSRLSPDGQYQLGILCHGGYYGLQKDLTAAVDWYHKAAVKGHREAQRTLGYMCEFGIGVPKDCAQAAVWYRQAAEQGCPYSQFTLGRFYHNGCGVPQDLKQAAAWYRKATEPLNQHTQFALVYLRQLENEGISSGRASS
jgi:TPR repeat protein